ncbi:hypothetical protein [Qaidamihabitans albus]|uniref:hypothetical protein n=1 Tax=Qaidamihabitans albus TaxID=2795733 RepID=UPI001F163812|nr:hypothetical protein [Qaidamihabitans albus]
MSPLTRAATATPGRRRIMHAGSPGMILGGLLLLVGSLMPWVSTPVGHLSGAAGAGLWTLCAGTIAIAGALMPYQRVAFAHALLPGAAAAVLVLWQLARLMQLSASTDSWGKLLPGIGLVLVGGAAVILLRTALRIRSAG